MKFLLNINDVAKRLWFSILYVLINIVIVFGFVCPFLISYDADFLVVLGFAILIADASHLLFFIINLVKTFK
jgi:hypothetical protein